MTSKESSDQPPEARAENGAIGVMSGVAAAASVGAIVLAATALVHGGSGLPTHVTVAGPIVAIIFAIASIGTMAAWKHVLRAFRLKGRPDVPVVVTAAIIAAAIGGGALLKVVQHGGDATNGDAFGVAPIAAVAAVSGVIALVVTVLAGLFDGRRRISSFATMAVITAAIIAVVAVTVVHRHRTHLWQPTITGETTGSAAIPTQLGSSRYRLRLAGEVKPNPDTYIHEYLFGSGFLVWDGDTVFAHDGVTGKLLWTASDFADLQDREYFDDVLTTVWGQGSVNVVVFKVGSALVGVSGPTGKVLWRKGFHDGISAMRGGNDALAVTSAGQLLSLDPASGRTRWSRPMPCSTVDGGASQLVVSGCDHGNAQIVGATSGTVANIRGLPPNAVLQASGSYYVTVVRNTNDVTSANDNLYIIDQSGNIVDHVAGARAISGTGDRHLLIGTVGQKTYIRNFIRHQSIPINVGADPLESFVLVRTTWVGHNLLIRGENDLTPRLVNPDHPSSGTAVPSPCIDTVLTQVLPAPGAVIFACDDGESGHQPEVVGMR